jgi:S-adenosylmethionine:tRNA ribosyltransferase-isomerase
MKTRKPTPDLSRLESYHYDLPKELIAQEPAPLRDHSRLMVIRRAEETIEHYHFSDILGFLTMSDLLVMNNTRVAPVAMAGFKSTGGGVELLCLNPAASGSNPEPQDQALRECMTKSSKPLREGSLITLNTGAVLKVSQGLENGRAIIEFPVKESEFASFLEVNGRPPLPPYIRTSPDTLERDRLRYQTVYSRATGSVAAPTAGFHFTEELLDKVKAKVAEIVEITLHVGPGAFIPIRTGDLARHEMEKEFVEIPDHAASAIRSARASGKRIIAVGTTSMRGLESLDLYPGFTNRFWTDLFIRPGFEFKYASGLITNFHLPRSTLLTLVCAFAGYDLIMAAYKEAIKLEYRFYSYGDACLII